MTCFCENPELLSKSSSNTEKTQVSLLRELYNQPRGLDPNVAKVWVLTGILL